MTAEKAIKLWKSCSEETDMATKKKSTRKPAGKMPMKKIPNGKHRMPNGKMMSDAEMERMMYEEKAKPKRKGKPKGKKK